VSSPSSYREQATAAFAEAGSQPDEEIANGLRIGTDYLDVSLGFLTRIEEGTQEIVQATGSHPSIRPGEQCPLDEAYCRRTVETEGTLSVQAAGESDLVSDDAIDRFGLGTYVGAKVTVGGDLYGTICFADGADRDEPFPETEELFVELLAERIGNALERQSYEEALTRRSDRLKAEKRRFEGIADASTDVIFRIDDTTDITYASSAIERTLGYDPEALVGESFRALLAPDSIDDAVDLYRRVIDGEPIEGVELDLEAADGTVYPFEVNARPIDDGSDGCAIQGTAREVTERKERQRELEIRNRAMDEAELGIVIADATREDNPITYVNDEFCGITGYDREEMLGANCRVLQGPSTEADAVAELRRGLAAEEPVSVEIVNHRWSGQPFWNEVTVTPVENDAGEVVQYIGFQRDVTGRKRRQKLLNVMNRVLRHNLRNKMSIVLGADGSGGKQASMVREAAEELLSLADRARDLYAYAGIDREIKRLNPGNVFDDIGEGVATERPDVTVTATVETDRDIAAGSELTAALAELVENAYVHDPEPDTGIELTARDDGDDVVVRVLDDGPGINDMERQAVVSGEESALSHGSGLGLWFVNWVVTRYGGSFQVDRREEGGTEATVRVPAVGPDESAAEAARRPTVLGW
jgi:PAS domain S-box-containing protein